MLPTFFSDNYVTLAPHEAVQIAVDWPGPLRNTTGLVFYGYNVWQQLFSPLRAALTSS